MEHGSGDLIAASFFSTGMCHWTVVHLRLTRRRGLLNVNEATALHPELAVVSTCQEETQIRAGSDLVVKVFVACREATGQSSLSLAFFLAIRCSA